MMPARPLHLACTALARLTPHGLLAGGCLLAGTAAPLATVQAAPFWHHFFQKQDAREQTRGPAAPVPSSSTKNRSRPTSPVTPRLQPAPPLTLTNEDRQAQLTLFTALNFMMPRLLRPHTPQELCQWGLATLIPTGQTTSAPAAGESFSDLHVIIQPAGTGPARLRLLYGHQFLLLDDPLPDSGDITGWSLLAARAIAALHQSVPRFQLSSEDTLLARFLNGILARLDPYSRYQPPAPAGGAASQWPQPDRAALPGQSPPAPSSVGLTLRQTTSRFPIVAAINLASPLWDAGVTPGDSLINLNGRSTRRTSLPELQARLAGAEGSTVQLGFRLQDGQYLARVFTRRPMMEESVFPDHAGPYVILHVTHFSSHTAEEISQYLSALMPDDATADSPAGTPPPTGRPAPPRPGLVLDLRGNHGGMLQQAVTTAALFLDHGIIATTEGRAPDANHVWSIQGGDLTGNAPLVLLVDNGTGSAAEVLAAALADHRRAVVAGSSTFGKGMVQVSAIMPNGGHLSLTWARITAPRGWALQGLGVIPQLCTAPLGQFPLSAQLTALHAGHSLMAGTLQKASLIRTGSPDDERLALRQACPPAAGTPLDLSAALSLLVVPNAYQTALLPPMPADAPAPPVTPPSTTPAPAPPR